MQESSKPSVAARNPLPPRRHILCYVGNDETKEILPRASVPRRPVVLWIADSGFRGASDRRNHLVQDASMGELMRKPENDAALWVTAAVVFFGGGIVLSLVMFVIATWCKVWYLKLP